MFVVPIKSDIIKTKDGGIFTVLEYTNFKSKGPAVYVKAETPFVIYFFDIDEINDVKVDFNGTTKVFTALGHLKRKIHLPQKHDTITLIDGDDEKTVLVETLKLHSKTIGLSRGLVFIDKDGDRHSLSEIGDIERSTGTSFFDRKKFARMYTDYFGEK
ncbi:MAG: hypothetical protein QXN55_01440 [Candidatus Nitrosotenuis sp.]